MQIGQTITEKKNKAIDGGFASDLNSAPESATKARGKSKSFNMNRKKESMVRAVSDPNKKNNRKKSRRKNISAKQLFVKTFKTLNGKKSSSSVKNHAKRHQSSMLDEA